MRKMMIAAGILLCPGTAMTPAFAAEKAATTVAGGPEIAAPAAGMGQVVFYRPSSMGALVSCRVSTLPMRHERMHSDAE